MGEPKEQTIVRQSVKATLADAGRVGLLAAALSEEKGVGVNISEAYILAVREACERRGLVPKTSTEVERIEADVPNGHAGRSSS